MKYFIQALLVSYCLLLYGCPLQTDAPIMGDRTLEVPKWLPGKWAELKNTTLSKSLYQVKLVQEDSSRVTITGLDPQGNPDPDNVHEAVVATIRKQLFISIYDKGDDQNNSAGYYHYAMVYNKNGDLELIPVTELLLASTASSEELLDYFINHSSNPDYFDQANIETFRKQH